MSVADIYRNRGVNPLAAQSAIRIFGNYSLLRSDANLIAYFPMQGNSNDPIGGNSGSDANVAYGVTAGKVGYSAGMSNAASTIRVTDASFGIYGTSPFTESLWIHLTALPASYNMVVMGIEDGGSPSGSTYDKSIEVGFNGAVTFHFWDGAKKDAVSSASAVSTTGWYLLTGTYTGTNAYLYINGVQVGTVAPSSSYQEATPVLTFSMLNAALEAFNGAIQDAVVFTRALSVAELLAYYNWSIA